MRLGLQRVSERVESERQQSEGEEGLQTAVSLLAELPQENEAHSEGD